MRLWALLAACTGPIDPEDTDETDAPAGWDDCARAIDVGRAPPLDDELVFAPSVLRDPAGGYRMWYAAKGAGSAILHARSDDGVAWGAPEVALAPGTAGDVDAGAVATPNLFVTADGFGITYDGTSRDATSTIVRCTSTDGLAWTGCAPVVGPGNVPPYDDTVISGHLVATDRGWRLYYVGLEPPDTYRILVADSVDGVGFTGHRVLFDLGAAGAWDSSSAYAPFVTRDAAGWRLLYSGRAPFEIDGKTWLVKRLIEARSVDGLAWTGFTVSLDLGCEGTWDDARVDEPWVLPEGDGERLWYDGFDDPLFEVGVRRILTAFRPRR